MRSGDEDTSDIDDTRLSTRAWARLARAAAQAHACNGRLVEANRELFDAIEHAATVARMDLRELVDAYLAGMPHLDVHEASAEVEDYLHRIADVQQLDRVVALPEWRERLAVRIAVHDLALAAQRILGGQEQQIEATRLAVVDVLNGAAVAGASDSELDAFVRELRVRQCDLGVVVAAAAWVASERARHFGATLPVPAWATVEEIARDRGVPVDVVEELVDEALRRGLLAAESERGVSVTPAGQDHINQTMRL